MHVRERLAGRSHVLMHSLFERCTSDLYANSTTSMVRSDISASDPAACTSAIFDGVLAFSLSDLGDCANGESTLIVFLRQ